MGTEEIGNRIRQIRRAKDLTQGTLAERAGVTLATVSRIELGKHDATVTTLRKIAEGLGVTLATLILEDDERPTPPIVEVVTVEDILKYMFDGERAAFEDEEEALKVEDAIGYALVRRSLAKEAKKAKGRK